MLIQVILKFHLFQGTEYFLHTSNCGEHCEPSKSVDLFVYEQTTRETDTSRDFNVVVEVSANVDSAKGLPHFKKLTIKEFNRRLMIGGRDDKRYKKAIEFVENIPCLNKTLDVIQRPLVLDNQNPIVSSKRDNNTLNI